MSAETKAVRAAGGKISIVDPEHNERGRATSETQQFKHYGTESSKNAMHGTAKVVAVGGKVSVSSNISGAREDPNYHSGTQVVVAKNGEVSIQPWTLTGPNGEGKHQGHEEHVRANNGKITTPSFNRPPNKKGGTKGKGGKEPVTAINQLKQSKTFRQTPRSKDQQNAGTRGSKAK